MAGKEKEDSFRVIDRRLFTAEGDLREEAAKEAQEEEKAAAAKAKPAGKDTSGGAAASGEKPKAIAGFSLLVELIARNAVALLGGLADPRTGQPLVDLEGAREVIDMLDALREKTRGNLAAEEDQMLLDVIGSLKVSFLEMSKAIPQSGTARREKSPGKA